MKEIEKHKNNMDKYDMIIGIGGGKTLDTAKAVENIIEANTYLSGVGFESSGLAAAHAIHNGLTKLKETHSLLHGEKVAFGAIVQVILENRPLEEIVKLISFCKSLGLPTTFKELNLPDINNEALMNVAQASCDQGDTMENMPFAVLPGDVFAAMKTANRLASAVPRMY